MLNYHRPLSKSWTLCLTKYSNAHRLHSIPSPCLTLTLLFNNKFKSLFKLKHPTLSPLVVVHIQEKISPLGTVHWRNKMGAGGGKNHKKHLIWSFYLRMLQANESEIIPIFICHSSTTWMHNILWVSLVSGGHLSTVTIKPTLKIG